MINSVLYSIITATKDNMFLIRKGENNDFKSENNSKENEKE